MSELADFARRFRRDAKRNKWPRGATRRLDGWRVALTFEGPTETDTRPVVGPTFGKAFLVEHAIREAKDSTVRDLWHVAATWILGGEPSIAAKAQLSMLLVALDVPENRRRALEPARFYEYGSPGPKTIHIMWQELPAAKA